MTGSLLIQIPYQNMTGKGEVPIPVSKAPNPPSSPITGAGGALWAVVTWWSVVQSGRSSGVK